jgi:glutaredoxin 2
MTNWNKVLSHPTGQSAIKKFALGEYSCEDVQQVFRNKDREASGDVRRLIRNKGTQYARRIARKALRRRNLI